MVGQSEDWASAGVASPQNAISEMVTGNKARPRSMVFPRLAFSAGSGPVRSDGVKGNAVASEQQCPKYQLGHRKRTKAGAGEGNRTLVCSLGSCRSTIELRPR